MSKIRFREVKKAILKDFMADHNKWNPMVSRTFIADLKFCHSTEEIILVLVNNGFSNVEALDKIMDCITRV
jgi:hypothetical protein